MSWTMKISCVRRSDGRRDSGVVPKTLALSCLFVVIIFLANGTSAAPPNRPSSRSLRELHANHQHNTQLFKNMQATTLHSLQGVVGDSSSSLSIVSPLDVLRQNMVMEIIRRRIRHAKQKHLQSNKEILDRIG